MAKTTKRAAPKGATHFEHVPVDVVKKIARLDRPATRPGNVVVEPKTEPYSVSINKLTH